MDTELTTLMKEVNKTEQLIRKTLVYRSPVTQKLDYRVAYFKDHSESDLWERTMDKEYNELQITHSIYTHTIVMTDPYSVFIFN